MGRNWEKENGARPHFIKKCGFDKSNPYIKTGRLE